MKKDNDDDDDGDDDERDDCGDGDGRCYDEGGSDGGGACCDGEGGVDGDVDHYSPNRYNLLIKNALVSEKFCYINWCSNICVLKRFCNSRSGGPILRKKRSQFRCVFIGFV